MSPESCGKVRLSWWLGGAVLLWCVGGCCPGRPAGPPFSHTPAGRTLGAQGITSSAARAILADASPYERRALRELMFIANLHSAAGNESNPVRLYHRVRRELAHPVTVPAETVGELINGMARMIAALPRDERGLPLPLSRRQGWAVVKLMVAPAQGALPSRGECLRRILRFRRELAVAFLFREIGADHHYHRYNMRAAILRALAEHDHGAAPAALSLYAYVIRTVWRSSYSSVFTAAVRGARQVLGPDFDAWYWEIRGRSHCADVR